MLHHSGLWTMPALMVALGVVASEGLAANSSSVSRELANQAYRLTVSVDDVTVNIRLEDKRMGAIVTDGPCIYRAAREGDGNSPPAASIQAPLLVVDGEKLTIHGRLAGLAIEHVFWAPADRPILEERIVLRNDTGQLVALKEFEVGMTRRATDKDGRVPPMLADDRVVAVPLRYRVTDPKGHFNDFSIHELATKPGMEQRMNEYQSFWLVPSRHRCSEGWAWTHGKTTLGIFSFNQENMLFSVLSTVVDSEGTSLRLGGAVMIDGEPAALGRIGPGQEIDLGTTRFETVEGGYPEAMYAYRTLLDEKGCRFPADFNPPVHWEQLYDMDGAWNDRPKKYTKAILEKEAEKAVAYSCESLYLDPGWDTALGSFLWGEERLGTRKRFIDEMQSKYGLKVSLHCPLAPWASSSRASPCWGGDCGATYPKDATRLLPPVDDEVPLIQEGRRNLALLPAAKANASSVHDQGRLPIHQIAHLNDGWYGNEASWIAAEVPAWIEIDLGANYEISRVCLGNDHTRRCTDRQVTDLRLLTATEYNADGSAPTWHAIAEYHGEPIAQKKDFSFSPTAARWVRVEIQKSVNGAARVDDLEIWEAKPFSENEAALFADDITRRRRPRPDPTPPEPMLCLGSEQYLAAATERLLANCADGATFLMFDGNWWSGICLDPKHGHPVPYRVEDHMRANVELARRVHAKFPKVLIEMHDMVAGGAPARLTPLYYKYGLPGSFDDLWGFELMWNPLADIMEGRGVALYYANMGCNVPIYTHVNLAKDNPHCLVLWWYASTCRHLGIGGTHADPNVVKAQQEAMKWYRAHEQFFKRGEFYGISDEIHLHVLPEEKAFVVNLFNLSDKKKTLGGSIDLGRIGLKGQRLEDGTENVGSLDNGVWTIRRELAPWAAEVVYVRVAQ